MQPLSCNRKAHDKNVTTSEIFENTKAYLNFMKHCKVKKKHTHMSDSRKNYIIIFGLVVFFSVIPFTHFHPLMFYHEQVRTEVQSMELWTDRAGFKS